MKNNNGKGLYEIGESHVLSCGCVEVAEKIGYTLYIKSGCPLDDRYHPPIKNYQYRNWDSQTSPVRP